MLDSLLHTTFKAAGVPTNADECLEVDQSDLAGHSARFLMVYGICSTCKGLFQTALFPRGQYDSWSKHFFAEAGLNVTL